MTGNTIEISYVTGENVAKVRGEGFTPNYGAFIYLGSDSADNSNFRGNLEQFFGQAYSSQNQGDLISRIAGDQAEWLHFMPDAINLEMIEGLKATEYMSVTDLKRAEAEKLLAKTGVHQKAGGRIPD